MTIGLGGVGAPLLGLLADAHGLKAVFEVIAALPVLALVLTLALPRRIRARPARFIPTRNVGTPRLNSHSMAARDAKRLS